MKQSMFTDVWDHPTTAKADARGLALEEILAIDEALAMLEAHASDATDFGAEDDTPEGQVGAWLDAFAAAVRAADYAAGEKLFANDVVGFGTVGVLLTGRESLVESQWKRVWGATSGFRFDMRYMTCGVDGDTAWIAVPWSSRTGRHGAGPHDRTGRATYVLQRRNGRWVAVHSHHSIDPTGMPPGAANA